MRRYDIVSGILLILSVINFVLAAPVLVQEKRQTSVDEVHTRRDMLTMLGKRMDDDFGEFSQLLDGYFRPWKKPAASSSSAPLGPDHGSTNAVQAPVSDPAPSDTHVSSSSAALGPDHGLTNVVLAPAPSLASPTANPIPLIDLSSSESSPTASSDLSNSKNKWLFETQVGHMIDFSQPPTRKIPNRKKRPLIVLDPDPDPKPDFVSDFWKAYMNRPRPGSASPKEIDRTSEYQAGHVQQSDPGLSRDSGFSLNSLHVPASVVHPPSMNAWLPTWPENEAVTPSESSPNPTQPVDSQAAVNAAKGKAKESRHISGTTGDVGNAAQRELQSDERSLDPGG